MDVLERTTRQVLVAATAELDGLRLEAEAAEILAGAARELLPRTGGREANLTTRLDEAAGGCGGPGPAGGRRTVPR